jgi:hypothetical protein
MVLYTCINCNKIFKQKGHYKTHLKKKFKCEIIIQPSVTVTPNVEPTPEQLKLTCYHCKKVFKRSDYLKKHVDERCKIKKQKILDNEIEKNEILGLKNKIVEFEKKISEFENKNNVIKINESQINPINEQLFNIIVKKDKKIAELNANKKHINIINDSDVSDTIKNKDKRIKLLEDLCLQKHKRKEYPERNVIYMLTTEENKKNGIYIIGKAINLKARLTPYNKTCTHEVVYYKECKNKDDMKVIEEMVLKKLNKYREVANRDRFILPAENDISVFTNIIDQSIAFFN